MRYLDQMSLTPAAITRQVSLHNSRPKGMAHVLSQKTLTSTWQKRYQHPESDL
jgi:hypothetical protein